MLEQLRNGDIVIESTKEREVALMFLQVEEIATTLVDQFDWRFLVVPPETGEVVLPDVGVTIYDPSPPFPESGTGMKSSAESETVLHLGPRGSWAGRAKDRGESVASVAHDSWRGTRECP
jgi:hypothetical protein